MKKALVVLLTVLMCISLVGCTPQNKPQYTVKNVLDAFKNEELDKVSQYLVGVEESDFIVVNDDSYSSALLKLWTRLEYEIKDVYIDNTETAYVITSISNISISDIIADFIIKAFSYSFSVAFNNPPPSDEEMEAEMNRIMLECISNTSLELKQVTLTVELVKQDNIWKIKNSEEFLLTVIGATDLNDLFDYLN